jgi:hypothetical protein
MKRLLYASTIAGLLASGCSSFVPEQNVPDHPSEGQVLYHNTQYNFTFYLPASWQGYSVLVQQWNGQPFLPATDKAVEMERGPIIVLRHPQWKTDDPWQDIPILVFTRRQWKADRLGRFSIDADGSEYEIAHNAKYVFAIWSLFNWDESVKGAREAEGIVRRNQAANAPHLYPEGR